MDELAISSISLESEELHGKNRNKMVFVLLECVLLFGFGISVYQQNLTHAMTFGLLWTFVVELVKSDHHSDALSQAAQTEAGVSEVVQ